MLTDTIRGLNSNCVAGAATFYMLCAKRSCKKLTVGSEDASGASFGGNGRNREDGNSNSSNAASILKTLCRGGIQVDSSTKEIRRKLGLILKALVVIHFVNQFFNSVIFCITGVILITPIVIVQNCFF